MIMNTRKTYGLVTKLLHASIGALIIYLMYLGWTMSSMEDSPEKWTMYAEHKSFGMIVLMLATVFYVVKLCSLPMDNPDDSSHIQIFLSKLVKTGLLITMSLFPLSGYIMSSSGGHPIKVFDWFEVPLLVEKNATWLGFNVGEVAHSVHGILLWTTISLLVLHVGGALYHHFIQKDDTLKRMTTKFKD